MAKKEEAEKFWKEEEKEKEKEEKEKRVKPKKKKISLDGEKASHGLVQLILTVIELLRELMEKQAIRRIEYGSLTEEQIERLGNTFMALKEELKKLKKYFKLKDEDLDLDLGPLALRDTEETGKASVIEILDRLLSKGVIVKGDVIISVAEVDLIALNLGLLLASIDKSRELYGVSSTAQLEEEVKQLREENLRLKHAKNKV